MGNEREELTLFYELSEESMIARWNNDYNPNDNHDFSDKYKSFREDLIHKTKEDESSKERNVENTSVKIIDLKRCKLKKRSNTKYSGISAAAIAASVLVFSMSVYAVAHFYQVYFKESEDGSYIYQVRSAEDVLLQPVRLQLNYLPEGYELHLSQCEEEQDGIKKYRRIDGSGGFSVYVNSYYEIDEKGWVSEIEKINLNGVEAIVFKINGDNVIYPHRIDLHYKEMGHVVSIYGQSDISMDEMKKIAENLELMEIEGEMYEAYVENPSTAYSNSLGIKKGIICEDTIVPIGTPVDLNGERSIKVADIELMDNISDLPKSYFDRDLTNYLNEDGTFKLVNLIEKTWEDNEMFTNVAAAGHIGFAYLTLEVANLTDEYLEDEFVWVGMSYRNPETDSEESAWKEFVLDEIPMGEPVYYDSTDSMDPRIHTSYISDFEAGETRIVHMGLLYLKEREEDAYISMRSWIGNLDDCYVKLVE